MKKILLPLVLSIVPAVANADSSFSYDAFGASYSRNVVPDEDLNQDLIANEFGASVTKELQNQWYLGVAASQSVVDETVSDGNYNYDLELTATGLNVSLGRYFPQTEQLDLFVNAGLAHINSELEVSVSGFSISDEFMLTALSASFGARILLDRAGTFEVSPALGLSWDDQSEETDMGLGVSFAVNLTEQFATYADASASINDENYSYGVGFRVYY